MRLAVDFLVFLFFVVYTMKASSKWVVGVAELINRCGCRGWVVFNKRFQLGSSWHRQLVSYHFIWVHLSFMRCMLYMCTEQLILSNDSIYISIKAHFRLSVRGLCIYSPIKNLSSISHSDWCGIFRKSYDLSCFSEYSNNHQLFSRQFRQLILVFSLLGKRIF